MRARIQAEERTCFQEAGPYVPEVDSQADVAIVYGLDDSFETRVNAWRTAGYRIHVMTGAAWGDYASYVRGEWDGRPHFEDAQTETGNFRLEHGLGQGHDIYYMVPSRDYTRFLSEKLRRVVDAGALAIHLEEPEFWVRAGYGAGFEREWQEFYGEAWQDPTTSPDARYRASKLMQHLYTRSVGALFSELKRYAHEHGQPDFRCYVPTHSLINYAHWRIVSPESKLRSLPDCDGIIGQVWTGTSRTPTVYQGVRQQRTFEAGYCEYAACAAMVRGTSKRLWQLADPIEDNPNYCWDDYRVNWESTVAAALLIPESQNFEIMPWPRRIFLRDYPTTNLDSLALTPLVTDYLARLSADGKDELAAQTQRALDLFLDYYHGENRDLQETLGFAGLPDTSTEMRFGDVWATVHGFYKILSGWEDQQDAQNLRDALWRMYQNAAGTRAMIPPDYAAELQIVWGALSDLASEHPIWLAGQTGVGLALADSLMFQRGEPSASDADMSSVYGIALPLLYHGVALQITQMERFAEPGYLDDLQVIFLTYEGQKPPDALSHTALVHWVQHGNTLVLVGQGDVYDNVREWWNDDGRAQKRAQAHLLERAGVDPAATSGKFACGDGWIIVQAESPAAIAHSANGPALVLDWLQAASDTLGRPCAFGDILALRRGPYVTMANIAQPGTNASEAFHLPGLWVDLFDAQLTVCLEPTAAPGQRRFLYDLSTCPAHAWVIAAAGRVQQEANTERSLSFLLEGIANTSAHVRVRLPAAPTGVTVAADTIPFTWDETSRTAFFSFPNQPEGTRVFVAW